MDNSAAISIGAETSAMSGGNCRQLSRRLAPALPASSMTSDAIVLCFAPEHDGAPIAVTRSDNCEREILVGDHGLTTGAGVVDALIRTNKGRGGDVVLIADRATSCERTSGVDPLVCAGIVIWIDHAVRIAHAKSRTPRR